MVLQRRRVVLLLFLMAAVIVAAAPLLLRAWWWWRESNPVRRGAELAARVGCLACHGPGGTRGLRDPGLGAEVPTWDGGVPMMYVEGEEEVREYILDGVSRRRAASATARAERDRAAIRMPAYRGVLASRQVDDLVAYFYAASAMRRIDDPRAARGRDLVRLHGCESCHGAGGSGGVRNPGSLKGYVPGWLGPDYPELVRGDEELRQWILEGVPRRLLDDRLARFFLQRQRLQMPAYRPALTADDAGAIGAYITWLRRSS